MHIFCFRFFATTYSKQIISISRFFRISELHKSSCRKLVKILHRKSILIPPITELAEKFRKKMNFWNLIATIDDQQVGILCREKCGSNFLVRNKFLIENVGSNWKKGKVNSSPKKTQWKCRIIFKIDYK